MLVGGQGVDEASAVAVDAAGHVYLAGTTASPNFPGATGAGGAFDVFVTKLDRRGTSVLFSAYVGGAGADEARDLAIDAQGHAYVVGITQSGNFPTRSPRQAAHAGGIDGFLFKLSTTGAGLVYSTYFGGTDTDEANTVAIDAQRNAYIGGSTRSTGLPVLNARQAGFGGVLDGFVARFDPAGALLYSTFHGGSGSDTVTALGVDTAGNATVTGSTTSTDFPLLAQSFGGNAGRVDAFVSRFSTTGTFIFSTYFGADGADIGQGVAVSAAGYSFIVGTTASALLPTVNAIQAHVWRVARCLPARGVPRWSDRVRDLLRRGAQRTGPRDCARRGGSPGGRRPDHVGQPAGGAGGAAGQRRQPRRLRAAARPAPFGRHLRHLPRWQQQRRGHGGGDRRRRSGLRRRGLVLSRVGRAGFVRRVRLRTLERQRSRGQRRRRHDRRLGDAIRPGPGSQRRGPRPRWRRRHQPAGAREQHTSAGLLHPLSRRGRDRHVLRQSGGAVQPGRVAGDGPAPLPAGETIRNCSSWSRCPPTRARRSTPRLSPDSKPRRSPRSSKATRRSWSIER